MADHFQLAAFRHLFDLFTDQILWKNLCRVLLGHFGRGKGEPGPVFALFENQRFQQESILLERIVRLHEILCSSEARRSICSCFVISVTHTSKFFWSSG